MKKYEIYTIFPALILTNQRRMLSSSDYFTLKD
jgi:hypothetical protein